jgi:hypothetical protein
VLAFEIDILIPVGSVQKGAFVFLKSGNCGPPPIVQNAAGVDQNIAIIGDFRAIFEVLDLDIIAVLLMVPISSSNLVLGLDEMLQSVLIGKRVEIVVNFLTASIDSRPIEFGLERPSIVVCGDIASASQKLVSLVFLLDCRNCIPRIFVLKPCARDLGVLFVDGERVVGEVSL